MPAFHCQPSTILLHCWCLHWRCQSDINISWNIGKYITFDTKIFQLYNFGKSLRYWGQIVNDRKAVLECTLLIIMFPQLSADNQIKIQKQERNFWILFLLFGIFILFSIKSFHAGTDRIHNWIQCNFWKYIFFISNAFLHPHIQ